MVHPSSLTASRIELGSCPLQDDGGSADEEIAEPVHLGPGVIERRDAEELVGMGLKMVRLLRLAGVEEIRVGQQDRLGAARGART